MFCGNCLRSAFAGGERCTVFCTDDRQCFKAYDGTISVAYIV